MFKKRRNRGFIEGLKFAEESSMGLEDFEKSFMSETRTHDEIEAFRQGMADYFKHRERVREWTGGRYGEEPGDHQRGVRLKSEGDTDEPVEQRESNEPA